jgi:multidrug resistance protein
MATNIDSSTVELEKSLEEEQGATGASTSSFDGIDNSSPRPEGRVSKDLEAGETGETHNDPAEPEDPNVVSWDSEDDPEKPVNWRKSFRWTLIGLQCASVFVVGLSSSIFAPGVPQLMAESHSSNDILATLVVTIYVLGLATGPLLFGPLSELYGRLVIQHVGNVGFTIFTVACAVSPNLNTLIGMRLLQGIFAAVPLTNGGGVIADTVKQEERGFALALFTLGLLAGPVVGPVIGGFLSAAKGWRWAFWLCDILVRIIEYCRNRESVRANCIP